MPFRHASGYCTCLESTDNLWSELVSKSPVPHFFPFHFVLFYNIIKGKSFHKQKGDICMVDKSFLKVCIKRTHNSYNEDEICIDEIENPHWDNISGGVQRRQYGYSLYGYIPYQLAMQLNISCSGRHNKNGNSAKVLIIKPDYNSEYYEGYKALCTEAGEKPKLPQKHPLGTPPTTQMIISLLSDGPLTRGEIKNKLSDLGYYTNYGQAINRLKASDKIECQGSPNSKFQIISLKSHS